MSKIIKTENQVREEIKVLLNMVGKLENGVELSDDEKNLNLKYSKTLFEAEKDLISYLCHLWSDDYIVFFIMFVKDDIEKPMFNIIASMVRTKKQKGNIIT